MNGLAESASSPDIGPRVELGDHRVPGVEMRAKVLPERLTAAPLEVGEVDTLLLDPGVVTEVENSAATYLA